MMTCVVMDMSALSDEHVCVVCVRVSVCEGVCISFCLCTGL